MFINTHLSFTDVVMDYHERVRTDFKDRNLKKIINPFPEIWECVICDSHLVESYESESQSL